MIYFIDTTKKLATLGLVTGLFGLIAGFVVASLGEWRSAALIIAITDGIAAFCCGAILERKR